MVLNGKVLPPRGGGGAGEALASAQDPGLVHTGGSGCYVSWSDMEVYVINLAHPKCQGVPPTPIPGGTARAGPHWHPQGRLPVMSLWESRAGSSRAVRACVPKGEDICRPSIPSIEAWPLYGS